MFPTSNSIFKKNKVPKSVRLDDADFNKRLIQLEKALRDTHEIEVIPNGWKCSPKKEGIPGYIVTKETVVFVMKNLGIM